MDELDVELAPDELANDELAPDEFANDELAPEELAVEDTADDSAELVEALARGAPVAPPEPPPPPPQALSNSVAPVRKLMMEMRLISE